jgi:hypothetical protein
MAPLDPAKKKILTDEATRILVEASPDAAMRIVSTLNDSDPKEARQAAQDILDRVGVRKEQTLLGPEGVSLIGATAAVSAFSFIAKAFGVDVSIPPIDLATEAQFEEVRGAKSRPTLAKAYPTLTGTPPTLATSRKRKPAKKASQKAKEKEETFSISEGLLQAMENE